jgi:O-antigen ligase
MTASSHVTVSDPPARTARALWRAAAAVLAVMPVGMVIAHRSSPAFIVLSGLLSIAALAAEDGLSSALSAARASLRSPLGRAALAFLAWTGLSLIWSDVRGLTLHTLGEFWLPVAGAFVCALALPARTRRAAILLLAAAIGVACVLILAELHSGLAVRKAVGLRADSFIFNRPVLTLVVVAIPLVLWLPRTSAAGARLAMQAGLAILILAAVVESESGAAKLAVVVCAVVFAAARLAPRATSAAVLAATVAAMALAPVLGQLGDRLIPPAVHAELAESHSRDRLDIWLSFGAAVREQPLLGAGFGVSARMADTPVASQVPTERRVLLGVGHPHNGALQIWAELGAVGAILAGTILVLLLRSFRTLPPERLAPRLALFCAAGVASLVGHGAWQGWWPAAIGAAVVWFPMIERLSEETE